MYGIGSKNSIYAEEQARQEIRGFVNEGLKDVQNNSLFDFDDVFDELESRYKVESV